MAAAEHDVLAAFRLIIGQEPTQDQVKQYTDCDTAAELRTRLFGSPQFRRHVLGSTVALCRPLDWPAMRIDIDIGEDILRQKIDRMERNFRCFGETEPHWKWDFRRIVTLRPTSSRLKIDFSNPALTTLKSAPQGYGTVRSFARYLPQLL